MDLIRRDAWGARAPRGKPIVIATPVRDLFLHHSAGPDGGPETIRAIQSFHQNSRQWADIAYTWLYSPKDRVFYEGRGPGIAGAHTRGHNRTSHAVCVLGNYQASVPPRHVIADLADWARWHGDTWGPNQYRGHNAVGETLCPGKHLDNLIADINAAALEDAAPIYDLPVRPSLPSTVRLGSTGDDVKLLQAAIFEVDGVFGPVTHAAVREYQKANGLTVDGICGPETWATILKA
jgi:N-acetylmuramoyl-L-alanine amidase